MARLGQPVASRLLDWEQQQADALLADVFGYHAVQLGWPQLQALRSNRMPHRWMARAEFEPILPQPKSTSPFWATCSKAIGVPFISGQRLGPTVGLGNGNLHRLRRAAVAPDGQLEGRVEPFRRQHGR